MSFSETKSFCCCADTCYSQVSILWHEWRYWWDERRQRLNEAFHPPIDGALETAVANAEFVVFEGCDVGRPENERLHLPDLCPYFLLSTLASQIKVVSELTI